jgi:hypothetical protein
MPVPMSTVERYVVAVRFRWCLILVPILFA